MFLQVCDTTLYVDKTSLQNYVTLLLVEKNYHESKFFFLKSIFF